MSHKILVPFHMTVRQHPLQVELQDITLKNASMPGMLGAPEVLTVGSNFIHLIGGRRVIDIGTFTGASALAWALAVGEGGLVYTLDICHENFAKYGVPIISKDKDVFNRIIPIENAALETLGLFSFVRKIITDHNRQLPDKFLDRMIADGKAETIDFIFIDADKENYPFYYERAVTLLRKRGVLMIDNALWSGKVAQDPSSFSESTKRIDETNRKIFLDDRTYSALLNCGDGIHIAFKI
ncbi:O-methyltransferase [Dictyocaulus viviparus]|uniref:O-methyltransferase n=1 Tax=Dictyocaulus viviparus TaxID=29172 RepID=A0A0D8XC49_DICVI|nr:O-methyltransferase [Dictyocaulus viviparus]